MYIRERLAERERQIALAQVLRKLLDLPTVQPAVFKELIADPRSANAILDENEIAPLPPDLNLAAPEASVELLSLGAAEDADADMVAEVSPAAAPAPHPTFTTQHNGGAYQEILLFDEPSTNGHTSNGHRAATNGYSTTASKPAEQPLPKGDRAASPATNGNGAQRPPNGKAKPTTEGSRPTPKPAPTPAPARHPAAPPFVGMSTLSSPQIPTDWDGLSDRVQRYAEERGLPTSPTAQAAAPPPAPYRTPVRPSDPTETNVARFILSFAEVTEGFLRITHAARGLFHTHSAMVTCTTEFGQTFPLWIDWQREKPIAYNQEALRGFFEGQGIPAGGIVYLERQHSEQYRLFYNHAPHTVREVRIAFAEDNEPRYEIIDAQVECETDDAILRAEKRFEDQKALMLEAVGKRSVEETLCDLLMSAPNGVMSEEELTAVLGATRMLAASTVPQTLRSKAFFQVDTSGNWHFEPAALLHARRPDLVGRWQTATRALLTSGDEELREAQEAIRPPLNQLRERLLRLERAIPTLAATNDLSALLVLVSDDPYNDLLASDLLRHITDRIALRDADLVSDPTLRRIFQAAPEQVWSVVLRPALRELVAQLQREHEHERALALAQCWSDFDQSHGYDLAQLAANAQAWRLVHMAQPTLDAALQAVALAPTLPVMRQKLHAAAQFALQHSTAEQWRAAGDDAAAVAAFAAHIATVHAARPHLDGSNQQAFDSTVQQEAHKLWRLLANEGKLQLALQLARVTPGAKLDRQQIEEALATTRHHVPLQALLVGLILWRSCPQDSYTRRLVAQHLAHCLGQLKAWEIANIKEAREWKQSLDEQSIAQLRQNCHTHRETHLLREQDLLALLQQPDASVLGLLLAQERQALARVIERDLEQLMVSQA